MAQMGAAENALRMALMYEQALAARTAASAPKTEPWPPDARTAPPGFAQPAPPQQLQPQQRPPAQVWRCSVYCKLVPGCIRSTLFRASWVMAVHCAPGGLTSSVWRACGIGVV